MREKRRREGEEKGRWKRRRRREGELEKEKENEKGRRTKGESFSREQKRTHAWSTEHTRAYRGTEDRRGKLLLLPLQRGGMRLPPLLYITSRTEEESRGEERKGRNEEAKEEMSFCSAFVEFH